jgi:hypothetical protein
VDSERRLEPQTRLTLDRTCTTIRLNAADPEKFFTGDGGPRVSRRKT